MKVCKLDEFNLLSPAQKEQFLRQVNDRFIGVHYCYLVPTHNSNSYGSHFDIFEKWGDGSHITDGQLGYLTNTALRKIGRGSIVITISLTYISIGAEYYFSKLGLPITLED